MGKIETPPETRNLREDLALRADRVRPAFDLWHIAGPGAAPFAFTDTARVG